MPTYEIEDQFGRVYEVDGDTPPSEAEIDELIGSLGMQELSAPPPPRTFQDPNADAAGSAARRLAAVSVSGQAPGPAKSPYSLMDTLALAGTRLQQGFHDLGEQGNTLMQLGGEPFMTMGPLALTPSGLRLAGPTKKQAQFFREGALGARENAAALEPQAQELEQTGIPLVGDVTRGAMSLLPAVAAGPLGVPGVVAAAGAQQGASTLSQAQDVYEKRGFETAKDSPIMPNRAFWKAAGPAAIDAAQTAAITFVAGKLFGQGAEGLTLAGKRAAVKDVVKQSLGEAVEEGTQQLVSDAVIAKLSYNPEMTFAEALAGAKKAALVGGILGGGVTLGRSGLDTLMESEAEKAEVNRAITQSADEIALQGTFPQNAQMTLAEPQALPMAPEGMVRGDQPQNLGTIAIAPSPEAKAVTPLPTEREAAAVPPVAEVSPEISEFASGFESGRPTTTNSAQAVGLKAKSVADLEVLVSSQKRYLENVQKMIAESEKQTDPVKAAEMMDDAMFKMGSNQFPREALETAVNAGSNVESANVQLGPRPLDWKTHPEVAEWLRKNASTLEKMSVKLPKELKVEPTATTEFTTAEFTRRKEAGLPIPAAEIDKISMSPPAGWVREGDNFVPPKAAPAAPLLPVEQFKPPTPKGPYEKEVQGQKTPIAEKPTATPPTPDLSKNPSEFETLQSQLSSAKSELETASAKVFTPEGRRRVPDASDAEYAAVGEAQRKFAAINLKLSNLQERLAREKGTTMSPVNIETVKALSRKIANSPYGIYRTLTDAGISDKLAHWFERMGLEPTLENLAFIESANKTPEFPLPTVDNNGKIKGASVITEGTDYWPKVDPTEKSQPTSDLTRSGEKGEGGGVIATEMEVGFGETVLSELDIMLDASGADGNKTAQSIRKKLSRKTNLTKEELAYLGDSMVNDAGRVSEAISESAGRAFEKKGLELIALAEKNQPTPSPAPEVKAEEGVKPERGQFESTGLGRVVVSDKLLKEAEAAMSETPKQRAQRQVPKESEVEFRSADLNVSGRVVGHSQKPFRGGFEPYIRILVKESTYDKNIGKIVDVSLSAFKRLGEIKSQPTPKPAGGSAGEVTLTAKQMAAAKAKVREHYNLERPVTDVEVIAEIENLRRKEAKGNLDNSQERLLAALEVGKEPIQVIKPARETITPSEDKQIGVNAAGEKLYQRADGSVYRMRNDRKDRPQGYPDFGGDLAQVTTPTGEAGAIAAAVPLTPAPAIAGLPPKSQRQIITDLAKGLNLPIRFGRLTTTKFAGYFKTVANLIGSKKADNIPIVSHEVGHKLDSTFKLSADAAIAAELNVLGDPATPGSASSWTKSKTKAYKMGEGVAEFTRLWLTDPAKALADAPNTHRAFVAALDANKDVGDVMRQAQEDIQVWRTSEPQARLRSQITTGNPNKTKYTGSQLIRDLVDDLHILRLASEHGQQTAPLAPSRDPYLLARNLRGSYGMADTFVRHGVADFNTKEVTLGTSLSDALKPVAGKLNNFRDWIVAKRAQELIRQGKETGLVKSDVDAVAAKFDSDPEFQKAFADVKAWNDALLQYSVDSGLVTPESAAAMRKMNLDYVPFHRVFEVGAGEVGSQSSGIGMGLNVGKPGSLKGAKGSTRSILDPLETMVQNAYTLITASEKAAISNAVAGMANLPDMGRWVERVAAPKQAVSLTVEKIRKQLDAAGADTTAVPDDLLLTFFRPGTMAPFGENTIRVTRDGKPEFYRLSKDLHDTFKALDLEDTSTLIRILAAPAQLLRSGVVLEPSFNIANVLRDTFSAAVINKYGTLPFETTFKGVAAMLTKPQAVAEWAAAGGRNSVEAVYFDRDKLKSFLAERISKDLTKAEKALIVAKSPLTALRWLTSQFEEATRIGEYQIAYKKLTESGVPEGEARRQAAFESRDRQDFAKGGAKTKIVRHMAAFWNAQLQANVKLVQAFKQRPLRTTLQGLAFVTIPKLLEQALNWDDDDYWDRPQWERDLFFLIPIGKDETGHTKFLRIPTPFEVGVIFGSFPGRLLQWIKTNRPDAMADFPSLMLKSSVPNPTPQSAQVIFETLLSGDQGWNVWRGRPIVPDALADLPADLQWTDQTSRAAKEIGKRIGFSPMKVDHIIESTTGGIGKLATGRAVPGQRFVTAPLRVSNQPTQDFYERLKELRQQAARAKLTGTGRTPPELSDFEATSRRLSELRGEVKKTDDEARKARLQARMLEIVSDLMDRSREKD